VAYIANSGDGFGDGAELFLEGWIGAGYMFWIGAGSRVGFYFSSLACSDWD